MRAKIQERLSAPEQLNRRTVVSKGSNAGGLRINVEVAPFRHTPYEDPVQNGIRATGWLAILCEPAYAVTAGLDPYRRNGARPSESTDRIDGVAADEHGRPEAENNKAK